MQWPGYENVGGVLQEYPGLRAADFWAKSCSNVMDYEVLTKIKRQLASQKNDLMMPAECNLTNSI